MKHFTLIIIFGMLACAVSKSRKTENLCQGKEALALQFAELVHHKDKYHRKFIEVKGFYQKGFEKSSLRPDTVPIDWNRDPDYLTYYSKIWLEFGPSIPYTEWDNYNGKFVSIKGIFDTSRHGHLGQYFAEIADICEIREVASAKN